MSAEEPTKVFRVSNRHQRVARFLKQKRTSGDAIPRFVGVLDFSAGRLFDPGIARLPVHSNSLHGPLLDFGDYRALVKIDLKTRRTTLYANSLADLETNRRKLENFYLNPVQLLSRRSPGRLSKTFRFESERAFSQKVRRAKESIARGDIYQANLSIRFQSEYRDSAVDLYRFLCLRNPSPYACLIKSPERWIVSSSPELLLEMKGETAITRPIAGTRPRGATAKEDRRRRGQLLLSPKERAEHIMLVDLERNDLGRFCRPGSVKVPERFAVERYSHVMHIVSEVR